MIGKHPELYRNGFRGRLKMSKIDWLPEQLKTSKNLCDIALLLIETGNRHLLATVLELLYAETQTILDENCIKG